MNLYLLDVKNGCFDGSMSVPVDPELVVKNYTRCTQAQKAKLTFVKELS